MRNLTRRLILPIALVVFFLLPADARATVSSSPDLFAGITASTTHLQSPIPASRLSLAGEGGGGDIGPGSILLQGAASFGTSMLTAVGVLLVGVVATPIGAVAGESPKWGLADVLLFGSFSLVVPAPSSAVTAWLVGGPGFGKRFGWAYLVSAAVCAATSLLVVAVRPESVPGFYVFGLLVAAGAQVTMANRVGAGSGAPAARLPEVRPTTALAESSRPRVRSVTLVSMSF